MDELTRYKIADHKLSQLSPLHNAKYDEQHEICRRYAHGYGNSCDYFYPYLYVRIYIRGGVMVHGIGYEDSKSCPLITKTLRIYAPKLKDLSWEEMEQKKDRLFSEYHLQWVRGKGYVLSEPFEDYTADLKSKCRIWSNLEKQDLAALNKKYEKVEKEYEYWMGI